MISACVKWASHMLINCIKDGMPHRVYLSTDDTMVSFVWHTIAKDECPVSSMADAHLESHAVISLDRWPQLYHSNAHSVLEMQYRHVSGVHSGIVVGMYGLSGCVWFGTSPPNSMPAWFRRFCGSAQSNPYTQSACTWSQCVDSTSIATLVEM